MAKLAVPKHPAPTPLSATDDIPTCGAPSKQKLFILDNNKASNPSPSFIHVSARTRALLPSVLLMAKA